MRFITFTGKESFRMKLESDDRRYSGFSNYAMRGLNIENNFFGLVRTQKQESKETLVVLVQFDVSD